MIRHVAADLYQIGQEVAGAYGREAVQVYLLLNEGRPILIDCGSHLHREPMMAELETVLEGAVPEYVFLTHSELPHAGNITAVVKKWPAIKVIVSNIMLPYIEVLPVLPLAQLIQATPGTTLSFPGRTLTFIDALLKDQPGSQWIYDSHTQALFTGDGFGYYHAPAQSGKFSDELPSGIEQSQFEAYHQTTFRFLRWVQPERLNADLRKLFRKRTVSIIAPIHGSAIRHDIPGHVSRLQGALAAVCHSYRDSL